MTAGGANYGGLRVSFLRTSFWCAAIVLGAADAWATRFTMNADGISYLDIGDAYWRGDWRMAINAYWSPLYSWILGLSLKLLKPSPYWEYPVVHLVNFLIYVGALVCFEFFLTEFIRNCSASGRVPGDAGKVTLPEWVWRALGYSLFIWTSLVLITIGVVTPDLFISGLVYLASGLVLKISSRSASRRTYVLLGSVLGCAFLAKAVMFPLAFAFLAAVMLSMDNLRKGALRAGVSALVFLLIAVPWMAAISRAKGRLTFGDSGRLTYAGCVNGVDAWFPGDSGRMKCGDGHADFVEGVDEIESPVGKMLRHPVQRIFETPATYQFAGPVGGSYPFWYDPSYWQEGIKPHFDLRSQASALWRGIQSYWKLCSSVSLLLNFTAASCIFLLFAAKRLAYFSVPAAKWPVALPASSALGLYALVHVEYRYIAPFVLILWLAAFAGVRLRSSERSRTLVAILSIGITATTLLSAVVFEVQNPLAWKRADPVFWQAAMDLQQSGIRPGDKVALIAKEPIGGDFPFIARLARLQVVAQVNRWDRFFAALPSTQAQVTEAIARTGAKAILTSAEPPSAQSGIRWKALELTNYCFCLLEREKP